MGTEEVKPAGVVLIVYPQDGRPHIVFTRRTELVATHKGQICFPGGAVDPGDASVEQAALRETHEELGVAPTELQILDQLDPVETVVTNYVVFPFVAYATARPSFHPSPEEVAEVIEAPLAVLTDPEALTVERQERPGAIHEGYFYRCGQHVIWGVTARILKQFLDRYSAGWWRDRLDGVPGSSTALPPSGPGRGPGS